MAAVAALGLLVSSARLVSADAGYLGAGTAEGAPITRVAQGSPAEQAGLRVGDIVTAVNDLPVTSGVALGRFMEGLPEGTTVRLRILRDGKEQVITARLSARPTGPVADVPRPTAPPVTKPTPPAPRPAPAKLPVLPALKAKPGYVVGRVTTMAGKPLAGVGVGIFGTTAAGDRTRFEVETAANGQYSLRVPDGIYGIAAYYETTYQGKNYRFTLFPTDGKTAPGHDASAGIVKNFIWKISGLKPNQKPGEEGAHTEGTKYYGGYVLVKNREEGTLNSPVYFTKGATLEITLTPRGPLIDGSAGQPVTFRRTFDSNITSSIHWYLTNVPVGQYALATRLITPGGAATPLNSKLSLKFSEPYTPSINVDFEPTSYGDLQMMQVTVDSIGK